MNVLLLSLLLITAAFGAALDIPTFGDEEPPFSSSKENLLNRRGTLRPPPDLSSSRELNEALFSDIDEQNADLKKVKYYLINGESRLANAYLSKLSFKQTELRPIIYRYMALLAFIEGKFGKSLEYLSKKELQPMEYYSKVCTLKVLNLVVLDQVNRIEDEWNRCQLQNFSKFNAGSFIWIQTLVRMKISERPDTAKIPFRGQLLASMDNEQLKIFLKLALYLGQEKLLEPQLNKLDINQVFDEEVRELMGHIYFRLGALAKSYRYIENLKSPNAENIKGNIYILRKKYELAYAQFKLALEQKQNSQNAMERLLSLAWLLGDWEEGAKVSERVIASPNTQINKLTLVAAFNTQKGDFEKARSVLESISSTSRMGSQLDVIQLQSFVGLMQNKVPEIKRLSAASCDQFDMVNCWLSLQMEQWDSFSLSIRRPDPIPSKKDWERLSTSDINEPLQETVFVNQLDVEELDDKLIKLIPNNGP